MRSAGRVQRRNLQMLAGVRWPWRAIGEAPDGGGPTLALSFAGARVKAALVKKQLRRLAGIVYHERLSFRPRARRRHMPQHVASPTCACHFGCRLRRNQPHMPDIGRTVNGAVLWFWNRIGGNWAAHVRHYVQNGPGNHMYHGMRW